MKLNLKQIQTLDFLLQRLNSIFSYTDETKKLNLVINFNNSLWKADFISLHNSYLENYYISNDFWIEKNLTPITELKSISDNFNFRRYENIKLKNINLLLHELLSIVSKINPEIYFQPCLYNVVNLETNFKIPFLYLDHNDKFEVVSIVESAKDECTRS